MQNWITEHLDFVLYLLFLITGLLAYNLGHHHGFVKGFRTGRRAGVKHPANRI